MKKNTWKKLMSLALGAMMMLSLLTGCGSKTEDSAPADSTPAEETPGRTGRSGKSAGKGQDQRQAGSGYGSPVRSLRVQGSEC